MLICNMIIIQKYVCKYKLEKKYHRVGHNFHKRAEVEQPLLRKCFPLLLPQGWLNSFTLNITPKEERREPLWRQQLSPFIPVLLWLWEHLLPLHLHSLRTQLHQLSLEDSLPSFLAHLHSFVPLPTHRGTFIRDPHSHHTCLGSREATATKEWSTLLTTTRYQETP